MNFEVDPMAFAAGAASEPLAVAVAAPGAEAMSRATVPEKAEVLGATTDDAWTRGEARRDNGLPEAHVVDVNNGDVAPHIVDDEPARGRRGNRSPRPRRLRRTSRHRRCAAVAPLLLLRRRRRRRRDAAETPPRRRRRDAAAATPRRARG